MRVSGQIVFNDTDLMVLAALQGQGLAYAFEDVNAGANIRQLAGVKMRQVTS